MRCKSYCITATEYKGSNPEQTIKKHRRTMVAEPICPYVESKIGDIVNKYGYLPEHFNPYNTAELTDKAATQTAQCGSTTSSATCMRIEPVVKNSAQQVYRVQNGLIHIKDKKYPIKLADGYYTIRKLTPVECERLQTMPDGYTEFSAIPATPGNLKKYKNKMEKRCRKACGVNRTDSLSCICDTAL